MRMAARFVHFTASGLPFKIVRRRSFNGAFTPIVDVIRRAVFIDSPLENPNIIYLSANLEYSEKQVALYFELNKPGFFVVNVKFGKFFYKLCLVEEGTCNVLLF